MWTLLVYVCACVAVCVYFWQNLSAPKLTLKSAVNLTKPWPVLPPIFTKQAQQHMRVRTCVYIHMCTFHLCMLYCVWRGLQWTCVELSHFIVSFPAWLEARVRVILLRSRKASSHCGTRSNLAQSDKQDYQHVTINLTRTLVRLTFTNYYSLKYIFICVSQSYRFECKLLQIFQL